MFSKKRFFLKRKVRRFVTVTTVTLPLTSSSDDDSSNADVGNIVHDLADFEGVI